jgi:hypothetical protein
VRQQNPTLWKRVLCSVREEISEEQDNKSKRVNKYRDSSRDSSKWSRFQMRSSRRDIEVVLGKFSVSSQRATAAEGGRKPERVIWRPCLCVILGVCASVIWSDGFCVRSVARRRLVETGSPTACATLNSNWCKGEIALCYLYVSVNKSGCVTQLLINPVIRTRTRLISGVHVTIIRVDHAIDLVTCFEFLLLKTLA